MKKILPIFFIVFFISCSDKPIDPTAGNRSPIISSVEVVPEIVGPSDSLTVICYAADPDGDSLVYDWYTTGVVKINGGSPGEPWLYHTFENSRIFYAPDSQFVSSPQDTFWIQCFARDRKGISDSKIVYFFVVNP